jgi:hypothetical protein
LSHRIEVATYVEKLQFKIFKKQKQEFPFSSYPFVGNCL